VPARGGGSIGGAMDLATGARRLIVAMEHRTPAGEPKVLRKCTYPLTAARSVSLIVTDLAVISVEPQGLVLREYAPGEDPEAIRRATEAPLEFATDLHSIEL
jgi:3-oxoacid CoA-transferase B subunit